MASRARRVLHTQQQSFLQITVAEPSGSGFPKATAQGLHYEHLLQGSAALKVSRRKLEPISYFASSVCMCGGIPMLSMILFQKYIQSSEDVLERSTDAF